MAVWAEAAERGGSRPLAPVPGRRESGVESLAASWAGRPADEVRRLAAVHVRRRVCEVLSIDPARAPGLDRPLGEAGLDSLVALELRNILAADAGLSLPVSLVYDYPTIEALAGLLVERLVPAALVPAAAAAVSPASSDLDGLSEDELAGLLEAELEETVGTAGTAGIVGTVGTGGGER